MPNSIFWALIKKTLKLHPNGYVIIYLEVLFEYFQTFLINFLVDQLDVKEKLPTLISLLNSK